jgi:recombination protein RecT
MAETTGTTDELKQALAARSSTPSVRDYLAQQRDEIALALPKHMDADRLARLALTTIRRTPQLLDATPASLVGSVMLAAQLGLEPGPLGHVYFVPFRNRDAGTVECQFILGYRGMLELARRSGELLDIEARAVYAGDEFDYHYGTDSRLWHRPRLEGRDPTQLVAVWARARFVNGGETFVVLGREEVEAHRRRSASQKADRASGPWSTDYDAMARKTAIRVLFPYLPQTTESAVGYAADGSTPARVAKLDERDDVLDVSSTELDEPDTGHDAGP